MHFYTVTNFFVLIFLLSPGVPAQMLCQDLFSAKSKDSGSVIDEDQSWGQQIFERELDKLFVFFKDSEKLAIDEKIKNFKDLDVRLTLFKLQSLSRTFSAQSPKYFEKLRVYFKEIEGDLGSIDLAKSLLKKAKMLDHPKIQQHFETQLAKSKENFSKRLESAGLSEKISDHLIILKTDIQKKANWQAGEVEKRMLVHQIADRAERLHKDVIEGKYTNEDLELGLHKLRREIRWLVVQASALNDLVVVYNEKNLGHKINNLYYQLFKYNPEIYENPYIQLSHPKVKNPIKIPRVEFALIADYALQIGHLKDEAEVQYHFNQAIQDLALNPSEKVTLQTKIEQLSSINQNIEAKKLSEKIQEELAKTKLLKHYADHFRQMNQ